VAPSCANAGTTAPKDEINNADARIEFPVFIASLTDLKEARDPAQRFRGSTQRVSPPGNTPEFEVEAEEVDKTMLLVAAAQLTIRASD
jgi:hypothetical protein